MKDVHNKLTEELDKYLIKEILKSPYMNLHRTYLYGPDIERYFKGKDNRIVFRVPGATRGQIVLDNEDTIIRIDFIEDTCFNKTYGCYTRNVIKVRDKFIGTKLNPDEFQYFD